MNKIILVLLVTAVTAGGFALWLEVMLEVMQPEQQIDPQMEALYWTEAQKAELADCLTKKRFILYSVKWCGWCQVQKEIFGTAADRLTVRRCDLEDQDHPDSVACRKYTAAGKLSAFPTWIDHGNDDSVYLGLHSLKKLAEASGCPAPK